MPPVLCMHQELCCMCFSSGLCSIVLDCLAATKQELLLLDQHEGSAIRSFCGSWTAQAGLDVSEGTWRSIVPIRQQQI